MNDDKAKAAYHPLFHAMRSGTVYPVAHWMHGSEIIKTFWGLTKTHAFNRAQRWGERYDSKLDK